MSSKCIEKIKHSCGANALQVFQEENGKYTGYCFSCGKYEPNVYSDKPADYKPTSISKTPEQIIDELKEIQGYQTMALPERKLKKEYLEYFDVKIGVSEQDGNTPVSHYYPYEKDGELQGYKVRLIEGKKMWSIGSIKGVDFFGWQQAIRAGGKKLFITEGELDAVALFQIFKEKNKATQYSELNPAIVSVSNGASGAQAQITRMLPEIRKHFKEIILVFDNDEPGKKAVADVIKLVPDAMVATLPSKDANQCLIDGRGVAAYNACQFNAQKPKNTRLVSGNELHESAKEPPVFGVSWPWKHITEATRGIRLGETIYIGAGQKQG